MRPERCSSTMAVSLALRQRRTVENQCLSQWHINIRAGDSVTSQPPFPPSDSHALTASNKCAVDTVPEEDSLAEGLGIGRPTDPLHHRTRWYSWYSVCRFFFSFSFAISTSRMKAKFSGYHVRCKRSSDGPRYKKGDKTTANRRPNNIGGHSTASSLQHTGPRWGNTENGTSQNRLILPYSHQLIHEYL